MFDTLSQFLEAIRSTGLQPPEFITPGKLQRFPGIGKRNGNNAGWCILFYDGLGGCFGDWSSGLSESWQVKRDMPRSCTENVVFRRRVKDIRSKVQVERIEKYAEAAEKAKAIWNSAEPAMFHDYLKQKQVLPLGIRIDHHNNLLVPLMDGKQIHSLQFIQPDGTKCFLKGGKTKGVYYGIAIGVQPEKLLICEGLSTAATLYMETKTPTAVAFYASNLVPVAKVIRKQYPYSKILICGDDDYCTTGNPGKRAAISAARACGGSWAIPDFTGLNRSSRDTDFNDLHRLRIVGQ